MLRAEGNARRRDTRSLDPLRRTARRLLLEELGRYRAHGRFPQNRDFRAHTAPVFVDEWGVRCAMAHLLEIGGAAELAASIARTQNFARIRELRASRALQRWLHAAGLTLEEAAQIQPAYGCGQPTNHEACSLCTEAGPQVIAVAFSKHFLGGIGDRPDLWRAMVRIESIPENEFGVAAGDEIVAYVYRNGQYPVVLGLTPAPDVPEGYIAREPSSVLGVHADAFVCSSTDFANAHPLPRDVYTAAFTSSGPEECVARLIAFDEGWGEYPCPMPPMEDSGCSLSGGMALGSPVYAASLSVILAVLAYRRRRTLPQA